MGSLPRIPGEPSSTSPALAQISLQLVHHTLDLSLPTAESLTPVLVTSQGFKVLETESGDGRN